VSIFFRGLLMQRRHVTAAEIQSGILTMCQQLVTVRALREREPSNQAAAVLEIRIRDGIRKNQTVLRRKFGVTLRVLQDELPQRPSTRDGAASEPAATADPDDAVGGSADESDEEGEDENDESGAESSAAASSSTDDIDGVPRKRSRLDTPPGSASSLVDTLRPVDWQRGALLEARRGDSAPLMAADGFANWLPESNRVALKLMQAMGFSVGKGLGRNEDGIAFPVVAYEVAPSSRPLGLGHPHRRGKEERAAEPRRRKRRRCKGVAQEEGDRNDATGSRAFRLVNTLAGSRAEEPGDEEPVSNLRAESKKVERDSYRQLTPEQLRGTLARKLRAKDTLTQEIHHLNGKLYGGGTEAHLTATMIDRKRAVLKALMEDVAALTSLVGHREKQRKALQF